ncbi:MAG: alpha-amylase family glycosyl hydrolase [Pseudomonadota bacterium]|nr:alpha-amylase family glycosyl hydrolase [Pseudomonadota bacterium]
MSADAWWKDGVIYQIYPRSYQDTDGDGIGDLRGIRQRLDHLVALGVDALWISPFQPSPMADFGYDISDYCGVDARFGTLADFDALVADAHSRGLKLILDFVPNHSSDQHPWFQSARSDRQSQYRDWYIWRDPAPGGGPPNNWLSNFGGPAWTLEETTGQYYYHAFLSAQPDLNWRNPALKVAMFDTLRFWLRRGVDGFRVDVIYHLIEDAQFRDNPPNPDYVPGGDPAHSLVPQHTVDQLESRQITVEMRRVLDEFSTDESARVLIGEIYLPIERLVAYYGADASGALQGAQLPFNFHLIGTAWQAAAVDRVVRDYEAALPPGAAPNWVLGNHDKPRIASRVGEAGARLAAMLLLTLRGTPTLYYGDEIGMTDVPIPPDEIQDPFERNQPGKGLGRDPQRTPLPWTGNVPHAGFSTGPPWLRLGDDWRSRNVAAQQRDAQSTLQLYQRLLALRRGNPALHAGDWQPLAVQGTVLAYARQSGAERVVVLLNFGDAPAALPPDVLPVGATVWLSTDGGRNPAIDPTAWLRPNEGVIVGSGPEPRPGTKLS